MSMADEIAKLNDLRQKGALSEEEYQKAKDSLLAKNQPMDQKFKQALNGITTDTNTWGMILHLSQFCGWIIPFAGLVVPIVLWQIKKNDSPILDRHGRIVTNWIITEVILGAIFGLLCLVLIGIPLLIALGVVAVVFPIVGAIKANNGEVWPYPASIKFFKPE